MKKTRMKYFSFDRIPYLYDMMEEFPVSELTVLDPDLKIAG